MEQRKEQLKYETELLRLAWLTALAVGGGNASLILGGITPVRAVLLAIGVLLIVIFASVALSAAAIAYMAWRISHHNE